MEDIMTAGPLTPGRQYRVTLGGESRNRLRVGEIVVAMGAEYNEKVTTDLTWSVGDDVPYIGSPYTEPRPTPWVTLVHPNWLEEVAAPEQPYGGLAIGDTVRIDDKIGTSFSTGDQGKVVQLGGWSTPGADTHVLVEVETLKQSIRHECVTKIEESPVPTITPEPAIASGAVARITTQNTQTNLAVGTLVKICRKHRTDDVWLVSTSMDDGDDAPRPTGRQGTGRTRWAMADILSVQSSDVTRAEQAPTGEVAVGHRVRIVSTSGSHRFPMGTEVILTQNRGGDSWRATTDLGWRVGDVQPGQTRSMGRSVITEGSRILNTGAVEAIIEPTFTAAERFILAADNYQSALAPLPTPAPPVSPAAGVHVRVIADTAGHGWDTGTTAVLVSQPSWAAYWLATTDLTWSPASDVPTPVHQSPAGAPVRHLNRGDFDVLNPQPSATPAAVIEESSNAALIAERDAAVAALATLRQQVRKVASQQATRRGWCSEIDEVLSEIEPGLTRLQNKTLVTRTLTVTYEVDGEFEDGCSRDEPTFDLQADALVDDCYQGKVRITSSAWGEPEMTTVVDDGTTVTGQGLQGPGPFDTTRTYRALANPRRFNGDSHGALREGMTFTLGNEGRKDSDGEVFALDYGYVRAQDVTLA